MKTRQINAILVDQAKRNRKIAIYICVIFVVVIFASINLFLFACNNKTHYVYYTEKSDIDYKVYLKENEFFENNYLGPNNQYIASLIDYVKAEFNYKLNVDANHIDYKYKYRIDSTVEVLDSKTNNVLYTITDSLKEEKLLVAKRQSTVEIEENVNIDYNYYNNLIKKFINVYDLDEVKSNLIINMYVDVLGKCEEYGDGAANAAITLTIPLTTKTVAVDISYELLENQKESFMAYREFKKIYYLYLVLSVIFILVAFVFFYKLVRYIIITRTAETIYERELKGILNNYKSYIQKINNFFDLSGYQVLKVDTFNDMLEIRDTIQEPILMVENKQRTGVYFLIPSKTKVLYLYGLKVTEIKKQMKED